MTLDELKHEINIEILAWDEILRQAEAAPIKQMVAMTEAAGAVKALAGLRDRLVGKAEEKRA